MSQQPETKEKKINRKLRSVRMHHFLTIEAAAERIGVSPTTYTRWEQGHQKPHLVTLGRLCKTFGTTAAELGFGSVVGDDETSTNRNEKSQRQLQPYPPEIRRESLGQQIMRVMERHGIPQPLLRNYEVLGGETLLLSFRQKVPEALRHRVAGDLAVITGYEIDFLYDPTLRKGP